MAVYRNIQLSFWTDNKVEDDFTPEDKYFYMYLLTNPQTNLCGCYEVSYRQMTGHLGYTREVIDKLLERFEKVHNVIRFNPDTKEILLLNWYKYNWSKSKDVLKGVRDTAKYIKCEAFKKYILEVSDCLENGTDIGVSIDPVYTPHRPSIDGQETSVSDTVTVSVSDSVTDTVNNAKDYINNNNISTHKKHTSEQTLDNLLCSYNISGPLSESIRDWIAYKKERRFVYKDKGLTNLVRQISENSRNYGDIAVINAISESMANGYQGIIFDKIRGSGGSRDQRQSQLDKLLQQIREDEINDG